MNPGALQFSLLGMIAIANGLFLPISQGLTGDSQLLPQLLGGLATGQQEPYSLVLELFAVPISVLLTHCSLSNGLIALSTESGEAQ